jgi:ribosomal protein S8
MLVHYIVNVPTSKQNISIFKFLKKNDAISFFEYLNSLNYDESTYILSLKSKFKKLHCFNLMNSKKCI